MYFKKMIGKRCYLSPICGEDFEKYTKWINDMDVAAGMIFASKVVTLEMERELLAGLANKEANFAIVDIEKDELIGNGGFPKIDYINRTGEVGIFIGNKDYWGNGYGTDAMKLLLDFGFNILNLNNISLRVYSFNEPAIKCYKKAGFKEAGRLREAKLIAGGKYDEIIMDILASEYNSIYIKEVVDKKKI